MDCLFDSGAIIALANQADEHRNAAVAYGRTPALRLHVTSAAVGEAFTFLRRRAGYGIARQAVVALRSSATTTIHHLDEALEEETWRVIEQFGGVPLSYVDATLVALGRRLRLRRIFAFDDDFRLAGLELVPR